MPSFAQPPLPHAGPLLARPCDHLPIGQVGRVALITGPVGFGKTTLLGQWAASYAHTIAWFNPVRMYQPEEILPGILSSVRLAVGDPEPVEPGKWQDPEAVAEDVIRLVKSFGKPLALVLDGTQFVRGDTKGLQESFRILIDRQPANLAAISTSRNVPIEGADVAQMQGRLDLITQDDLEIPQEVVYEALLSKGIAKSLANEMVELLQGWPAAVSMSLGMATIPTDLTKFRRAVSEQGVMKFLSETLIDRITPELRQALLRTSVAEVASPDLALRLGASEAEAGSLLTAFYQGVPVVRIDKKNSLVIHELFRDQLIERYRRENPSMEVESRRIYAEYLSENKDSRAIDEYIKIGDHATARQLLDTYVHTLVEAGQAIQVSEWYKILAAQYEDRAEYLRRRIFATSLEADIVRVQSLLDSFEDELNRAGTMTESHKAFLLLNRCWVCLNIGDLEAMNAYAREVMALDLTSLGDRHQEYIDTALAYVARFKTLTELAGESDPEVRASFAAANVGTLDWKDVQLPAIRALVAIYRGEANKALAFGVQAMEEVPAQAKQTIFFPWFGLVGLSGALREQGEAKQAINAIDEYWDALLEFHPLPYLVDLGTIKAGALADIGRMDEATAIYGQLRSLVERYGRGGWINDRLDFQEARFLLRHGDESRAMQLGSRLRDSATLHSLTLHLDINNAPKRAAQTLASMRRESPIQEMNFRLFSALLEKEQPDKSDQHIKHLLALMEEHGTMRVVVDRGRAAVDLISVYVSRFPSRYGENLVSRMQDALSMARPSGLVSPLSKREQQILGMLASAMTLKQIADSLFVSQNTLKTHLRHLYRKMQVGGRDQAVEQGRKLLLLP